MNLNVKLIDVYHTSEPVIDTWTFVVDEVDPTTGYYDMLATSETGHVFSQWTSGEYDPDGENSHLGERPRVIGELLVNHVIARMSHEPHES